ncbi:hypothetical protein [Acetobacter sp. LMG 32666]|uniref:hypothetical protein n=1 Tax=Acetobacter sp. LMG 32666 TaxID=2959295 RepID=UPI0030C8C723
MFSQLAQAANWAPDECRKRSPVRSGAFRKSWAVLVDEKLWDAAPATIPIGTEVWIVNTMPYARKIEVGGQKIKVAPQIIEAVGKAINGRFTGVKAQRLFKPLKGGRDARGGPVPYILRGAGVASGLSWTRKEGWSRKHAAYVSNRSDRQAGEQVLYQLGILMDEAHKFFDMVLAGGNPLQAAFYEVPNAVQVMGGLEAGLGKLKAMGAQGYGTGYTEALQNLTGQIQAANVALAGMRGPFAELIEQQNRAAQSLA